MWGKVKRCAAVETRGGVSAGEDGGFGQEIGPFVSGWG